MQGDIVLDAYKGRNVVLAEALSPDAYQSLEILLATKDEWINAIDTHARGQKARIEGLRSFLDEKWIRNFHDNDYIQEDALGDIALPEMLKASCARNRSSSGRGGLIMTELATETKNIIGK